MVGKFLNGDYGSLQAVDPHFSALLYAGDRFEAKPRIETVLNEGKVVLVDRYVGSNLAHQVARASAEKRSEFLRWIEHLEYSIYGMPREDLILYLRVPPGQAQKLVGQKPERQYTRATHDILEKSLAASGRRSGNVRHAIAQPAVGDNSVLRRAEQFAAASGRHCGRGFVGSIASARMGKEGLRRGIFGVSWERENCRRVAGSAARLSRAPRAVIYWVRGAWEIHLGADVRTGRELRAHHR